MIKNPNTNSSKDSSIENKTTATNNDTDTMIVDEIILTVQSTHNPLVVGSNPTGPTISQSFLNRDLYKITLMLQIA